MNLPAALFPEVWHWVSFLIVLPVACGVATTAPWKRLADPVQLNLLAGFSVSLTLMWSMNAGVMPGLNLHLLGAMAATLALGPQLAIVALALALVGITLNGAVEWQAWPLNLVVMVIAPILFAHWFRRIVERMLPPHFFIFIFIVAFAGSALAVAFGGLVASVALIAAGAYPFAFLASDYLPYFALLCFSEAWISGAILSLLVVYKPGWVAAFDDRRYLLGK